MAKIPNYRRISTGDFSADNSQDMNQLAEILNPFMRDVTDVINGQIDFENLSQNIIQFEATVDSNGIPVTKQVNIGTSNFNGFSVINARNITNPSIYPTGQPFISAVPTGSQVVNINNISNLPANNKFLLTVIVY
jgi:hypothetical protein